MQLLSHADPTADIACTLPVRQAGDRLDLLGALVRGRLEEVSRSGDRLSIRIGRAGDADIEANVEAWAREEKACCAFLGFAIESAEESVTLEIEAPPGADAVLDGVASIVRAVGRPG